MSDEVAVARATRGRRAIRPKANRPIIQTQRATNEQHENNAKQLGLDWRIVASTILHRYPVITPDPEPYEVEYYKMQDKIADKKREILMSKVEGTDAEFITKKPVTVEEILTSLPFTPASRVTEADKTNNRRSLDRRLQDSLYLVVKRNRNSNAWQFPQGRILDNEIGLRQASERVIDRAVGPMKRWFMSNAPMGHYCYAYPTDMQHARKQYGAKVYFYRAQLCGGNFKLETKLYKDFAWIARDEVGEYFDKATAALLTELLPP